MARKPTDKQLFKMKNEWLGQFYEEVKPKDFYRAVFPEGSFEREGHPEDEKCNGVLTVIEGEKARNYIVFDELNMVDEVKGAEFAIMSPVGYSGRNRTAKNARWLYGIAVDLDGVEMEQLRDVFHQMKHDFLPQCTYCVNSGHGLHLYYLFEKPVPLYRHLQDQLREFKYELIRKIWNRYTSTYTEREQVQYQGIFQGFRMVGTQSKLGNRYPVTAFETGERVTVEYLNDFLMDDSKAVTDFKYKSDLSLAEAKKKYPEWYEKRIVRGEKKGRWHIKRDLYDWWLRKIQSGAVSVGHRYWCLSVLASYGIKCDIPEDEVLTDALELLPMFDDISDDEHNRFTKRDVLDAMNMYQENYVTYSRAEVERVSGISVPPNKRNGRKQDKHLQLARGIRELKSSMGEAVSGGGRPEKSKIVEEWRKSHPDGTKAECIRETGLSKPTVYRWWREIDLMELREYTNKEKMVQLSGDESQRKAAEIVAAVTAIAQERGLSEEEAYEVFLHGKTRKEQVQEQAKHMVFAESEVDAGLLVGCAANGIRRINVMPDDEYMNYLATDCVNALFPPKNKK